MAADEAAGARVFTPFYLTLLAEALALGGKMEEGLAALDDALAQAAVSGAKGERTDPQVKRLLHQVDLVGPARRSTDASEYRARKSVTTGVTNRTTPCWQ